MMLNRAGITARIGIIIIAIVIVVVGVAVYVVYQKVVPQTTPTLTVDLGANPIILQKSATVKIPISVSTTNQSAPITLDVTSSAEISATITNTIMTPGALNELAITGIQQTTTATVTVHASQADTSAQATRTVVVIIGSSNTNTVTNTNTNTNSNTNSATGTRQVTLSQLKLTLSYPNSWGDAIVPKLVRLAPTQGALHYAYFSNVDRWELPGNAYVTASSANYIPTEYSGTPRWFATTFTPQASDEQLAKQAELAGFKPYEIRKVTIDGKPGIRMLYINAYYTNFLNVAYVIYTSSLTETPNVFAATSIDYVKGPEDFSDITDAEAQEMIAKLKSRTLSEQALRRFDQFEEMVKSFQFSQ